MYLVIEEFADSLDKGHIYHKGDMYPREGMTSSESRIKELASYTNRLGTPLIELAMEVPKKERRKPRKKAE